MRRGSIITTPTARVAVGFVTKKASQPVPWNPLWNMLGLSHVWSCLMSREVGDSNQIEGKPNATDYLLRAIAKGVIHSLGGFQLRGWFKSFSSKTMLLWTWWRSCRNRLRSNPTLLCSGPLNPLTGMPLNTYGLSWSANWTRTLSYCSQDSSITRRLRLPYATMPARIAAVFGSKREGDNFLRLL